MDKMKTYFKTKVHALYLVVAGPKQRYLTMFKEPTKEVKDVIDWVIKTLKKDDRNVWFLKNYKKDNKIWNEDNRKTVEHFMSMQEQIPKLKSLVFKADWSFAQGINQMKSLENDMICNLDASDVHLEKRGKKVIDVDNTTAWWDLGVEFDLDEAKAMGHCGNEPSKTKGDTLLSLRTESTIAGKTVYTPHLTFILNNGFLGEMKGRANEKPKAKYHKAIVELLKKHPEIKHIWGGGYQPERNFSFSDLTEKEQEELLKIKPDINPKNTLDYVKDNKKHEKEIDNHNSLIRDLKDKQYDEYYKKNPDKKPPDDDGTSLDFLFDPDREEIKLDALSEKDLHQYVTDLYGKDLNQYYPSKNTDSKKLELAISYIQDQSFLKKIYSGKIPYYSKIAALKNIKDQDFLKKIAEDETGETNYREVAVSKITDEAFLKKLYFETSNENLRTEILLYCSEYDVIADALKDKESDAASIAMEHFKNSKPKAKKLFLSSPQENELFKDILGKAPFAFEIAKELSEKGGEFAESVDVTVFNDKELLELYKINKSPFFHWQLFRLLNRDKKRASLYKEILDDKDGPANVKFAVLNSLPKGEETNNKLLDLYLTENLSRQVEDELIDVILGNDRDFAVKAIPKVLKSNDLTPFKKLGYLHRVVAQEYLVHMAASNKEEFAQKILDVREKEGKDVYTDPLPMLAITTHVKDDKIDLVLDQYRDTLKKLYSK